jgi:hypothetical protein
MPIQRMELATVKPLVGSEIDVYVKQKYGHFNKVPVALKGYLYHGTSFKNMTSIKSKGLLPTDSSADGTPALYGAQKFSTASIWCPVSGGMMLRLKMGTQTWKATDNKVFFSYEGVSPKNIEMLTADGWQSI